MSFFFQMAANKNVIFLFLKLSYISLISKNTKTPNFTLIYYLFISSISHNFICFFQVFVTWFSSYVQKKVDFF